MKEIDSLLHRQPDNEFGKTSLNRFKTDFSAMVVHNDIVTDGQSQTCPLPCRLGGEKWCEQLFPHIRRDTMPIIPDADLGSGSQIDGPDRQHRRKSPTPVELLAVRLI